jgi:hypothetical protein
MRRGHLRLVFSNGEKCENCFKRNYFKRIKNCFDNILLSKNEKIIIIKDCLIKIYRDYEETTGIIDIPYFVKADIQLSKIVKNRKIDYYYNRLKKFRNN